MKEKYIVTLSVKFEVKEKPLSEEAAQDFFYSIRQALRDRHNVKIMENEFNQIAVQDGD